MKISHFTSQFSILFLLFTVHFTQAQVGGMQAYQFLNLTNSARIASLGSKVISIQDDDITLAASNPSLLNSSMDRHVALSYTNHFSGINYGFADFSKTYSPYGSFMGGIQFVHYGKFISANETGEQLGEFSASDFALHVAGGRRLDSLFSIGANVKVIGSFLEQYTSYGLAIDVAGSYISKNKKFSSALVINNAGIQLKGYTDNNKESLPFEILLGISKRMAHAPIRLSLTLQHLEKWDLTYPTPDLTEKEAKSNIGKMLNLQSTSDKLMRHLILGIEFLPSKNVNVRLGYNYQRRKELMLTSKPGTSGLSWGVGIRISKFHLSYGRAIYHLAGATNHLTITTNLGEFYTKE